MRNLRRVGIAATTSYRAKDVASFVKKAMDPHKSYSNPLEEIRDKAGVRIVTGHLDDFRQVQGLIPTWFPGAMEDDKSRRAPDSFGYTAVHFEVVLSQLNVKKSRTVKREPCEIQLHSRASNLWSESEHDLIYKAIQTPPVEVERRMNRLVALTELFDSELSRCRHDLRTIPGYENAGLLMRLERQFFQLTASDYRQSLSLTVIEALRQAYPNRPASRLPTLLRLSSQFGLATSGRRLRAGM